MVRKEALRKAIEIVRKSELDSIEREEIIGGLELCFAELPFSHWSEAAIFDACDQWVQEHGQLHMRAFIDPAMPSHPTIKNRFKMTAKEFRDKYYPLPGEKSRSRYCDQDCAYWDKVFIQEFHTLKVTSQGDYNRRRDKTHPTWVTLARMHSLNTWTELLETLDLEVYGKNRKRPEVKVRLIEDTTFELLCQKMRVQPTGRK